MKNISYQSWVILSLLTILVFTFLSCKKEDKYTPPSDPAKAILGKWEIIEQGNWPNMEPYEATGYIEYLPDSIIGVYNYSTKEYKYSNEKYWIDSLLQKSTKREDGFRLILEYRYQFYDDKLRLDVNGFFIYNTSIYKRIK
jgi:hypothetical protein